MKSYVRTLLLVACAALLVTGCVIHAHNTGHGDGDSNTSGSASGSLSGNASASGSAKGSGKGSISFSKDPSKGVGRAKNPPAPAGFKARTPSNKGATDSAKPRKDLGIMKPVKRKDGVKPHKDLSPMKPGDKKDGVKPHKDLSRMPPGTSGGTDDHQVEEEPEVQDPPEEPSDHDFGYTEPVYGCFEGQVMFIEPDSNKLPTDYSGYEVAATLYACEWDIPTRSFDSGFPGVEDQFEWFAIRYTGAFSVFEAGTYTFRINSDDGTKLTIDGAVVVDNDGTHPPKSVSGTVELTAGDHNLVLEYFQGPRYHIALQVYVTAPGGEEGIFSVRQE